MTTTIHPREPPPLGELATVIQKSLESNFARATVRVTECPDLREPPFNLAAAGLSGSPRIADIGGQPNLFPCANLKAKYQLLSLAKEMEMSAAGGFLIGAGAAPFQDIGHNAELAANIAWAQSSEGDSPDFDHVESLSITNKTRVTEIDSNGSAVCCPATSTNCALMINLYGSSGDPGPVLKVTVKGRTGESNFTNCIRLGLREYYGESNPISLGGVFVLKAGKAKFHVMPDFPEGFCFRDREQMSKEWLTWHTFDAPVVCLTVMHSADPEKLGLRMEHTHCFDPEGDRKGGHYHYDVPSDEEVEYEAYLYPADVVYRIDRP